MLFCRVYIHTNSSMEVSCSIFPIDAFDNSFSSLFKPVWLPLWLGVRVSDSSTNVLCLVKFDSVFEDFVACRLKDLLAISFPEILKKIFMDFKTFELFLRESGIQNVWFRLEILLKNCKYICTSRLITTAQRLQQS